MTYDTLERENKHFYGRLARVALPIAIQSLIGSSLNLVDSLMVGSLGESQLAAVGVSVQIYFIFWMIVYGFSSGCSTFMAQFWGAKNTKQIRKTIGFTLTVCMAIGILFFLGATFFPEKILRIFTNIPETIALGTQYVRAGGLCFLFIAIILPFECALRATQQTHIPLFSSIAAFI
ncbi:MAG: MATE family efflux transporter, partial [Anaerovoracaceae bacterium]